MISLDSVVEFVEETKTITVGDKTAKIRKLDGVDRLRAPTGDPEKLTYYVIGAGLLDGETGKPVGKEFAYKFVRSDYLFSQLVFSEIMDLTTKNEKELKDAIEAFVAEEKNASLPPDESKFSGGDTASVTDSTPQPLV